MARHVVARACDLKDGERTLVTVEGREIAIFNVGGEYFALLNRCPHEGGSLVCGDLIGRVRSQTPGSYEYSPDKTIIRCPWHAWEFDIRTGQSWCDPRRVRVRTYQAGESTGDDLVKGPYVAETFEVSSDDTYIFLEL